MFSLQLILSGAYKLTSSTSFVRHGWLFSLIVLMHAISTQCINKKPAKCVNTHHSPYSLLHGVLARPSRVALQLVFPSWKSEGTADSAFDRQAVACTFEEFNPWQLCSGGYWPYFSHMAMGQKTYPQRTSQSPLKTRLKWVVHLPKWYPIGFDNHSHILWSML